MKYCKILIIISLLFCSENEEQYVILVSFDGFRYDYVERVDTPNFDYIEKNGVRAKSLKPIFPSFTFPNHYSIATGAYAGTHGLIANSFYRKDFSKKRISVKNIYKIIRNQFVSYYKEK